MSEQEKEKRNQRIGLITSVGIHAALLIAFLLMMAWRAPDPPYPEYGIELNFGLDNQGFGEVQPETPASATESVVDDESEQQQADEDIEPSKEPTEEVKPTETQEVTEQPVSKTDSPVAVTETKKEQKQVEKPVEKPVETKPKEQVKAEEKLVATYKKPTDAVKEKGNTNANQGDDPGKVGDKGDKEGSLDAKALYGKQGGGGGGVGLDLAGWNWDQIPNPRIPNDESDGKIEFEIKVDENGEIIGYKVLERSLSIEAEKACRDAISKLTFTKKSGAVVPAISVGKITFVVRTR